ncbi:MAG: quinoprotein dehydrogenase-associated putative ABC transporter substrate-binding protein [Thiotrichales bacterium]
MFVPYLCAAVFFAASVQADEPKRTALKVCADPNYAPFSTRDGTGFENRLAALLAADLGLPLEYAWFPQRMGFIRNTLRAKSEDGEQFKCDLVMGVPHEFELAITTEPYMHSTYALVLPKGGRLDGIDSGKALVALSDERKANLRIGMSERSPGTVWLAKYGLYDQIKAYVAQSGDPAEYPGEPILKDLLAGKLDAAVVWGPTAAHFAKVAQQADRAFRVVALESEPGVQFDFRISAAVRHADTAWRDEVDGLLQRNAPKIKDLFTEYGIPLVDDAGKLVAR